MDDGESVLSLISSKLNYVGPGMASERREKESIRTWHRLNTMRPCPGNSPSLGETLPDL